MDWKNLVKQDAEKTKDFKSIEELAKAELPRVQWIVWSSLPNANYYMLLVDMKETKSNELLLVFYSPEADTFYVAYAPPRFLLALKMLEAGYWIFAKVDGNGRVESMEYASSELPDATLQEMRAEFLRELAKAYRQRQRTWQKVYDAYSGEVPVFVDEDDEINF